MWEPTGVILEIDSLLWWHFDLVTQRKLHGCRDLLLCQISAGCRVIDSSPSFTFFRERERAKERRSLGWDCSRNHSQPANTLWEMSFGVVCVGDESGVAKKPHTTRQRIYQDREWSDCWRFWYYSEHQVHLWWRSLAIYLSIMPQMRPFTRAEVVTS